MAQMTFFDLLTDPNKSTTPLLSPLYKEILVLLESDISSALEICECLIKEGKLSNERYSSHKPKAYPKVCSILDKMVQQEKVVFIEDQNKKDRMYRLKEHLT
jgi:Protein of unknown function (DUF3895)